MTQDQGCRSSPSIECRVHAENRRPSALERKDPQYLSGRPRCEDRFCGTGLCIPPYYDCARRASRSCKAQDSGECLLMRPEQGAYDEMWSTASRQRCRCSGTWYARPA